MLLTDIDRYCVQALAALGLKTGGTVQQRAERLFLTKVRVKILILVFFNAHMKQFSCLIVSFCLNLG